VTLFSFLSRLNFKLCGFVIIMSNNDKNKRQLSLFDVLKMKKPVSVQSHLSGLDQPKPDADEHAHSSEAVQVRLTIVLINANSYFFSCCKEFASGYIYLNATIDQGLQSPLSGRTLENKLRLAFDFPLDKKCSSPWSNLDASCVQHYMT
jgi:hypothetical protein